VFKQLVSIVSLLVFSTAHGATFYVRPDGRDAGSGRRDGPRGAWRSIDRGQPGILSKDLEAGATEIHLIKATHFPGRGKVRIGKTTVFFKSRTATKLLGCRNTPKAKRGTKVENLTWRAPGPGDTVVVRKGVYTLHLDGAPTSAPGYSAAVVMIGSGGKAGRPVTFRGEGLPVIDAREVFRVQCVNIRADHVRFEGFRVRRGGITALRCSDVKVLDNFVHRGSRGVYFAYVTGGEIRGNVVFDYKGAWTEHGITVGRCRNIRLRNNTVVCSAWGIRIYGARDLSITNNLVAWCRRGIVFDKKDPPVNVSVSNNNLWKIGRVTWLQRDDQGLDFYTGFKGSRTDVHVDPLIVEWDDDKEDFLKPHADSPCVRNGRRFIGARGPARSYPAAGNREGENLVQNPSFESGLLGWTINAWNPFTPEQAGFEIVEDPGADGRRCLHFWEKPGKTGRINVRVHSSAFRITRGGKVTVSFMARAEHEDTPLVVGVTFPSWQNKSGVSEKATRGRILVGTTWKRYRTTIAPPVYMPDVMWVTFTIPGASDKEFRIDAVKAEEGAQATAFSPSLELLVPDMPGLLHPPGKPFEPEIFNRSETALAGNFSWKMIAPVTGEAAKGQVTFDVAAGARSRVSIDFPVELRGLYLMDYEFVPDGGKSVRGALRFSIGEPARRDRLNHDFVSATPPYANQNPGEIFRRYVNGLAALGVGTLHLYMGYKRINEVVSRPKMSRMLDATERVGIQWLFTPSDSRALTGKATWAPGPGNVGPGAIEVKRSDMGGGTCTPAQLEAWAGAIRLLATAFKGRVKYYEVLNEPNCFLDGNDYKKVLLVTSKTLRAVDPKARIVAGSVVNALGRDLYKATLSAPKGAFDAFSYHPYRFGLANPESEDESFRRDILLVKKDLRESGHDVPIFHTEEGMGNTHDVTRCIGVRLSYNPIVRRPQWEEGDILQAQYAAVMYITALGEGGIGYSYHTLQGLVSDALGNPQPALKALHAFQRILGDARPLGRIKTSRDFTAYLFALPAGRVAVALWMKDLEWGAPINVVLKLPAGAKCAVTRLFGHVVKTEKVAGGVQIRLDREVTYLIFDDVKPRTVERAIEEAFATLRTTPTVHADIGLARQTSSPPSS